MGVSCSRVGARRSARPGCRHFAFQPVFPVMAALRRVKLSKKHVPENDRVTGVRSALQVDVTTVA